LEGLKFKYISVGQYGIEIVDSIKQFTWGVGTLEAESNIPIPVTLLSEWFILATGEKISTLIQIVT
jgi:hypothetical protein